MSTSSPLLTPFRAGALNLRNRIVMAPLTRGRADPVTHVPTPMMLDHYAQRATAGLIITEGCMIAPDTCTYYGMPGVYSTEQLLAWRTITDAVHARGGAIVCQIWHPGRATHASLNEAADIMGPSAVAAEGVLHTPMGKQPFPTPREMTLDDIANATRLYATAAANCVNIAGFDGVEVHAANGFLIDQFLRDGANQRNDAYGGSFENRSRFLVEVVTAVGAAIGRDRVGVHAAPFNGYFGQSDSRPWDFVRHLAATLNDLEVAFVLLLRRDLTGVVPGDATAAFRAAYRGVLIGNQGYDEAEASATVGSSALDAVAFGAPFIANPDLVARIEKGICWAISNPATYYTQGVEGYNDYPIAA
ncbi:hypothetical protein ACHHYP_06168 [Achlya hypogyna]|uniref:NADH:flavin oxidoreductase/NADH oxidase N-terminal domain-containing protein n=1 Tax=Achlya hypogyna TaxID=1202772 RepID=A0A1V9ZN52_ACHHY|nr:hypothetical protein ACHHYP_06168 [Achlya hypogyna]